MTAAEVYELTTQGWATDFARLVRACESFGPYCLIGGMAVDCYVEPVYTLDAGVVVQGDVLGLAVKVAVSKMSRKAGSGPTAIPSYDSANGKRTNST